MIRRNGSKGILLITQNDHAAVAGKIAAHWGNETFPAPAPREAVISAIECHDAGWSMHDDKPTLNTERVPASFYEMPVNWYVRVWVASVSAAAAQGGPMAGLIVSWHFTSLALLVPPDDRNEAVQSMLIDFSAAQRCRRAYYAHALGLSRLMANYPPVPATDRDHYALYNLWLLRICDWLSLQLCDNALPELMRSQPVTPGCEAYAIRATWSDSRGMMLDPWPLGVPHLEIKLKGRHLPGGKYRTQADLARVYQGAAEESLVCDLVPAS